MRTSSLELLDQKGGHLGLVSEVMVDMKSGRVIAISLLVGDDDGMDRQLVVIPWEAVRFDYRSDCFRLLPHNDDHTVVH